MDTGTYEILKAALKNDSTLSPSQRTNILRLARNPSGAVEQVKYLTKGEAAEFLKVCKTTIWRLVDQGVLHPIRVGPRSIRYRSDELETAFEIGKGEQIKRKK